MEKKLIEIIESHPNLENKESLINDVKSMFEQIRTIRQENRKSTELLGRIKRTIDLFER